MIWFEQGIALDEAGEAPNSHVIWVIERVQAAMAEQETAATGEVRVACKPPSKVKAEKQQRAQGRST